ncbi:TIGR04282 family arsenosugar biosynthesis glycosyltransferase [Olleya sp. Bg11-27]|uniref:TIGR04282 family arsenosugar biosynthesis glycosyltransferase n=1 Tax=Olleya sp. Bg11-27 TaxID=2058135 RepID=UPI000C3197B2|nr:TIGR04282 family arsenosugar biosynthesis glycosyltransferase [Olleya sp. Bg11-27]AUC75181.1 glycosyltransferase [Olleya sp. Bg11-27]
MHKNLIITFTRNPELGKVKSRLAKGIGETSALEIYKFLLEHTKNVLSKLDCDRAVYYSVKIRENDIWDSEVFSKHQQFGDDLGARMQNAFDNGFKKGYEKIIIVGSDLYDLNTEIINQAFKKLDTNDNVIGPAEDGGYYLLGMKTLNPSVFDIENWGTETVYKQTVSKLTSSLYVLETLNDIDYVEDLKPYDIFKKYLK